MWLEHRFQLLRRDYTGSIYDRLSGSRRRHALHCGKDFEGMLAQLQQDNFSTYFCPSLVRRGPREIEKFELQLLIAERLRSKIF